MKRYYLPKTLTGEVFAAPLLVVADGWHKWFDNATKARRAVPPRGLPTGGRAGTCRGWTFSPTDEYGPRRIHNACLEVNPHYLAHVIRRLRCFPVRFLPTTTQSIVYSYMLIPAPDYALLKTNHKIGAPKGRLP